MRAIEFIVGILGIEKAYAENVLIKYCETLHPGCGAGSEFLSQLAERIATIVFEIVGGVSVIMILWGAIRIVSSGGSDEGRTQGKSIIIAALVGIFFAVTGWAIVEFVYTFVGNAAGN